MARTAGLTTNLLREKAPRAPVWANLGVTELAVPEMRIELEVKAIRN